MSKPKILVADDDRMLRALLSHKLKALGCDIVATENGKEALEVLQNDSIDLVIRNGRDGLYFQTFQSRRIDDPYSSLAERIRSKPGRCFQLVKLVDTSI